MTRPARRCPAGGSTQRRALALAWAAAVLPPAAVRVWNALAGPLMWGYDAWGHVAYVLFLDAYGGVPWPDQGWSYFHPPLHYVLGLALAQAGDAEVLVRGLALCSGAASLGVAALGAWCARRAAPERPLLAPLAFAAVAYLPAHLLLSAMPGNELTLALLASASLCVFVANETREHPRLAADAAAGALAGLALLAKFSGLLPVLTAAAALALRAALEGGVRRAALRAALIAGVALALAAPYYQRNVAVFGTPFQLSRDFPLVSRVEGKQRPGRRVLVDYLRVPTGLFVDPDPRAEHMLGSVWGTVYANVFADVFRESDVARETRVHESARWMVGLGVLPTALFAVGLCLGVGDVRRGRRRSVYLPLLVHTGLVLGAFAVFAWRVPIWSALKSSYLLGLSLPFAVFLPRALERIARGRAGRAITGAGLAAAAVGAAVLGAEGLVVPRRADAPATAAVRFHFGDYAGAQRVYARLASGAREPVPWLDGLGAVALAEGRPDEARRLYARAVALEPARRWNHGYRRGQLAVATALAGDREAAAALLDDVLLERDLPELRVSRGALHAVAGELAPAERALRRALEVNPELVVAHLDLAAVLAAAGRPDEARAARAEAARRACATPRRYPHAVGTGEVLEWGVARRAMLLVDGVASPRGTSPGAAGLRAALPDFYRGACRSLAAGAGPGGA